MNNLWGGLFWIGLITVCWFGFGGDMPIDLPSLSTSEQVREERHSDVNPCMMHDVSGCEDAIAQQNERIRAAQEDDLIDKYRREQYEQAQDDADFRECIEDGYSADDC